MENEKFTKIFRMFIAAALVVSLWINFTMLSKIDQLEYQINFVSNTQQNMKNEVNNQTGQIRQAMNEFINEQSWISTIHMDVDTRELKDGHGEARFEWQVKELPIDAEVLFHYAYGDSEDYTEVPAEELQQGLFQVKVPIEVDFEPRWEVTVIKANTSQTQEASKAEMEEYYRQNELKYFVSVSYDDMVKSGDIHTEHFGDFGTSYYGMIQTDVHLYDEKFNIAMVNHNFDNSDIFVEEAYLLKYEGDSFISEEKITADTENNPPDNRVRIFHSEPIEQMEEMRLILKVVYSDGEVFEKEVY